MNPVNRRLLARTTIVVLTFAGLNHATMAAESIIAVTGSQSTTDGACVAPIPFFTTLDCSYNMSNPDGFLVTGWQGPTVGAGYYAVGSSPGVGTAPAPDDGKYAIPLLAGSVIKIDDMGDSDCSNDTIEGNIILSEGVRAFAGGPGERGEETWSDGDIAFPFGPKAVDSGASNGGGCDYVIGTAGFPDILIEAAPPNREYPFDVTVDAEGFYQGPSSIPMSTIEKTVAFPSGNVGVLSTVARGASYVCNDNTSSDGSQACASDGANFQGARATLENMLVSISTDNQVDIVAGTLFAISESKVFNVGGDPNSWDGPKITFVGTCQSQCASERASIDIRPHNSLNQINSILAGNLWVAILGSSVIDATTIDISTVAFWPGGAAPVDSRLSDSNNDGYTDLLIRINLGDTAISCGDTEGTLTGKTFDGQNFVGTDRLTVTQCFQCLP
jgi:hypothetical protein